MCFGCSKEPSHQDGCFEYPQHLFWLRNKKNNFQLRTLIWGPSIALVSSGGSYETVQPHSLLNKTKKTEDITFNLEINVIKCENNNKLLGVTIDFKLNFNVHIFIRKGHQTCKMS